jgi:hypothetical protein
MWRHVASCWGKEALAACDSTADDKEVQNKIAPDILRNRSITAAFERKANGKWTYSNRPLTHAETKAEIVCWVCESLRPFDIVSNTNFLVLMKTGHPEFYIPSPWTVSHCNVCFVADVGHIRCRGSVAGSRSRARAQGRKGMAETRRR